MKLSKNKHCPRCNQVFECNSENITQCACYTLDILAETRGFLQNTAYKDCLCNNCMSEINAMIKYNLSHKNSDFIEGLHYYYENQLMVFTELYHIQRGYCCKNQCRHCPYGNKKAL